MNDIMNLFSLNGKNAVVTGANTGLGQGICVALAAAGAHVFGVARRSCDETAAKIAAEGGQFTEVRADLSDFAAIDSILEQVHAHADRIDILVNNAGIIKRCDAIDVTPENWDAVDFLNEKMVFFLSQAVGRRQKGRQDHQHCLDAQLSGRHPRTCLHQQQKRRHGHDQGPGQRVGQVRHQR